MTEEIVELAKTLGRVADEDLETLRALSRAAQEEAREWLREGVSAEDCGGAFLLGCAWLVLAGLCAGGGVGTVESFSAGGLTIRQGTGKNAMERAGAMRRQAELALGSYIRDREFSFLGVRGS